MNNTLDLKRPGFTVKEIETLNFFSGKLSLIEVSAQYGINTFHLMEYLYRTVSNRGEQICDNQLEIWNRYVKQFNPQTDLFIPSYTLSIPNLSCYLLYDCKKKVWSEIFSDRFDGFSSPINVGYILIPFSTH